MAVIILHSEECFDNLGPSWANLATALAALSALQAGDDCSDIAGLISFDCLVGDDPGIKLGGVPA